MTDPTPLHPDEVRKREEAFIQACLMRGLIQNDYQLMACKTYFRERAQKEGWIKKTNIKA